MHIKNCKITLLIFAFTIQAIAAIAQPSTLKSNAQPKANKDNSPYSRYGYGDLMDNKNAAIRGIGGIATAYNNPFIVNSYNPATYSFTKRTTFDFGIEARSKTLSMDNKNINSSTLSISYLAMAVPMGKHLGLSFGFMPITNIYYNAEDTVSIENIGKTISVYNGQGSTQFAYVGFAGKVGGFSLGTNIGYMFGSSQHSSAFENFDTTNIANAEFINFNRIGGFNWKLGALYQIILKNDQYIHLGATARLAQSVNITREKYAMSYRYSLDPTTQKIVISPIDTIHALTQTDLKSKINLPAEYSFGVHYGKSGNWNFGADFVYNDWSTFSNFGDRTGIADNSYRLGLGGEVTPNPEAEFKKYFSHIVYKFGFYYGKDYIQLNNRQLDFIGGTAGISLPLKSGYGSRQSGQIHTMLDIGSRGTIQDNLAREFYIRFTFGITFNDSWFHKRKFD